MDETTTTEMMDDDLAVAEAEGDLATFLAALDAAGIMDDFHGAGPFTLFIPTDEAFAAYLDQNAMKQHEAFAGGRCSSRCWDITWSRWRRTRRW